MTTKEQRAAWLEMRDKAARLFEHGKEDAIDQGRDVLALLGCGALRPLCEHVEALEAEVARLGRKLDQLREGEECHVSHPGEGTLECDVSRPCPACRLRASEAEVERLRRLEAAVRARMECWDMHRHSCDDDECGSQRALEDADAEARAAAVRKAGE